MSEDAFPRPDNRPSFDETRLAHKRGDRNKRDEDRHSFLQAILCARDRLIITCSAPASSIRTGANPSPVVWDLCEAVQRYYVISPGGSALRTVTHPLHAFDSRYFDGGDLPQSSSQRYLEIARAVVQPTVQPVRIELRTEPEPIEEALSVAELTTWLWNPVAAFIERVLRARFGTSELYEPTGALTKLGSLEASKVGNGALAAGLCGSDLDVYLDAAPEFPDGSWGSLERQRLAREIRLVNDRHEAIGGGAEARSELASATLDEVLLEGRLDGLGADQRVLKRFTKMGRRTELAVWVEHLLMQAAGLPRTTHLVLRGSETRANLVSFGPVNDPRGALEGLLALYRASRTRPLPLLEGSSRAFAEAIEQRGVNKALAAAKSALDAQRRWDPRFSYALGPEDPFLDSAWSDAFQEAALQVYGPLLQHRSER
jgi:exodeoxyribonuclease V gamma subunit